MGKGEVKYRNYKAHNLFLDKRFSREEFFCEMNRIFEIVYKQIGDGRSLIYWEEINEFDSRSAEEPNDHEALEADEKNTFSDIGSEFRCKLCN